MSHDESRPATTFLIPTYNDWDALLVVLGALDKELAARPGAYQVLVVDDGSNIDAPADPGLGLKVIRRVEVLRLRRNLGHQRAIAVGLCFLVEERAGQGIIVMDGDGEDRPGDVPRLLPAEGAPPARYATFAERVRRSEGLAFTLFYHLYRTLHRILTGIPVRMGNFSYLPWYLASRLAICGELWNHYAAAVVASRTEYRLVPCPRGHRVRGKSTMGVVSLVAHGLSAIAVFSDRVGVRVLAASAAASGLAVLALAAVLVLKCCTTLALPGWATTAGGLLVVFLGEMVLLSVLFVFVVLGGRNRPTIVPLRDYRYFVEGVATLWPK